MRILGIDPGLRVTGFGVIDVQGSHGLRYVASGVIRIPPGALAPRLKVIHDGIAEVIAAYRPTLAVAEIVFVNVNPQSTLLLGQARGAALTALVHASLPVAEYTALQMQAMVQRLLRLPGVPSTDAADALACAICHAHAAAMARAAGASALAAGVEAPAARRPGLRRGRLR